MKVTHELASAFGVSFEKLLGEFLAQNGQIEAPGTITSPRFLNRSILPHVQKLSNLFNREEDQAEGLHAYWKESSNPANLRLAYFLYFMPANLFRAASIWNELSRLGFHWPKDLPLKAVEFGAGPAAGICGIAAAEKIAPIHLPREGSWALIEQDKSMLSLGESWAKYYFNSLGNDSWSVRPFHRKITLREGLLPRSAPQFSLWLESFFLNEFFEEPAELATALIRNWDMHLEKEGLAILIEPALKLQSRRLLEVRAQILKKTRQFQVLLPCLGSQQCDALTEPTDWCHEEVQWWRPPYFKQIDQLARLDRKSLPFSYLVVSHSSRPLEEILPRIGKHSCERLVSPAHREGQELEFYICGAQGKRRARFRPPQGADPHSELIRGDILLDSTVRGDRNSLRIQNFIEKP